MNGKYTVKLTSAELEKVLTRILQTGIQISNLTKVDEVSCAFSLSRRAFSSANRIAVRNNGELEIQNRKGIYWNFIPILSRPFLLLCIFLLFFASAWIPQRILFVQIQGNKEIDTETIRSVAAESGVEPGAMRKELRSEEIKNYMLEKIPQLSWMGLNTNGCVAVISVSEKTNGLIDHAAAPGNVYAGTDGLVERITAVEGIAQCGPGDAVAKGQILIAGARECGQVLMQTRASGEVIGQTKRSLHAVLMEDTLTKQVTGNFNWHISLILGKKRINLWKDSGICHSSCGRMYKEYWFALPGGFPLPVCLAVECAQQWEEVDGISNDRKEFLSTFADGYLTSAMDSGQILDQKINVFQSGDLWHLEGEYLCREQLGVFQEERMGEYYGENG